MRRAIVLGTACGVVALCFVAIASWAQDMVKAQGKVELTDPSGDLGPITTSGGDEPPLDLIALDIQSDGQRLLFRATLAGPPGKFASSVLRVLIDTDNDETTGIEPFGDRPGGFEYSAEVDLCMAYEGGGTACTGSVGDSVTDRWGAVELERFEGDSLYGSKETLISAMAFPGERASDKIPLSGLVVTASVGYGDLGVASGQTIRLLPEETGGSPRAGSGAFPIVLLTLE